MKRNHIERAILENQIIMAEAMWMLLQAQGSSAALASLSTRIMASRKLLAEYDAEDAFERRDLT
jgi:hypothetical protein